VTAMKLAYRFALDPSAVQQRTLRSHVGAARFAWNWGLAKCRERYAAERKWYSGAELHKLWNAAKKTDPALGWWGENSKCCYQEAFRNLDRALRDFTKSRNGQRKGKKLGFPKYKKRGRSRDSFRLTGVIRCDRNTVTLPRLGTIATCESTAKLTDRIAGGRARVLSATVTRTAQRWFVSLTVEEDRPAPERHARPGTAAGIDLGIKALITGADSAGKVITIPGPRALGRGRWGPGCGGCGAPRGRIRGRSPVRPGAAGPRPGWPGCTPGSRTCAPTRCIRPRPCSPPGMRPWSLRT